MLNRFNRYPLIIDPSGQATEFILNEYKDKKITKTRLAPAIVLWSVSVFYDNYDYVDDEMLIYIGWHDR